jgi:hypothetical protein
MFTVTPSPGASCALAAMGVAKRAAAETPTARNFARDVFFM